MKLLGTVEDYEEDRYHFITFIYLAETSQQPQLNEPEKCFGWEWFDWNALPENLFPPFRKMIPLYHNHNKVHC
jgi:8-oxo-dGTP diphosphatase